MANQHKNPAVGALHEAPADPGPQAVFRAVCHGFSTGVNRDQELMVLQAMFPSGVAELIFPVEAVPRLVEALSRSYDDFKENRKPDLTVVENSGGLIVPS